MITGILIFGGGASTSFAEEPVPNWFKGVAGLWSQGEITTQEFLDGIEFLIEQEQVMARPVTLNPAGGSHTP